MKIKIGVLIAGLGVVIGLISPIFYYSVASAGNCADTDASVLGFPTWYRGLGAPQGADCSITFTGVMKEGDSAFGDFIWKIALNIIEIVIRFMGYIAAGYILYGGFTYLTAGGSPDKTAKGLKLIMNASMGLIISIASVAIINTLFTIVPSVDNDGISHVTIGNIINGIMKIVYYIAGAVSVIMIIVSGIRFVTSAGNPEGIQKARKGLVSSITGLIVIILAFTLTNIILGYF